MQKEEIIQSFTNSVCEKLEVFEQKSPGTDAKNGVI